MTGMNRRSLIGAGSLAALAGIAGCAQLDEPDAGTNTPTGVTPNSATSPLPFPANGTLLLFFSRAGENYWEGGRRNLQVGNTKVLADKIAERIGCDRFEICAADPYPRDYDTTVARNRQEHQTDARPTIDGSLPDLSRYTTILLGSPVWGTRAPMILRTFLDSADALSGKSVYAFLTYAVGIGSVFDDYARFCPEASVMEGLSIRGEQAHEAGPKVEKWLQGG